MTNEVRALGDVAGHAAAGLTRGIESLHRAVAARAWRPSGAAGAPARLAHDAVSAGVYGCVRGGLRAGAWAGGSMLGAVGDVARWRPVSETRTGASALGVLNGLVGDQLHDAGSAVGLTMTVRRSGRVVDPTPDGLAEAFPDASGHPAVFVHGLAETELAWRWPGAGGDRPAVTYGARLAEDLGVAPVHVRYNTGLPVARNGRLLDELLDALVTGWPVPVEQLTLVGHSMGGLVIRSACHVGAERRAPWTAQVGHAVYLGTPHLGAPLARGGHALAELLDRLPETRPLATALLGLSAGIRDLRHGDLIGQTGGAGADGWLAEAPGGRGPDVPLLAGCRHHAVSATVARRPGSRADNTVGDLLVQVSSATGGHPESDRPVGFVVEEGLSLRRAHHFSLLNHPEVYGRLRGWLAEPSPRAATATTAAGPAV